MSVPTTEASAPGPVDAADVATPSVPGKLNLSGEIVRYLRELVADRDGWTCHYCGRAVVRPPLGRNHSAAEAPSLATLDHWLPRARGGSWDLDNLVMACMPCNNDKHALSGDEYVLVLAYRRVRDRPGGRRWGTSGTTDVRTAGAVPGTTGPLVPGTDPETTSETARGTARETGGPSRDRERHQSGGRSFTTGHCPSRSRGTAPTGTHTLAGFPPGNLPDLDGTTRATGVGLNRVTGRAFRGLGVLEGDGTAAPAGEEISR